VKPTLCPLVLPDLKAFADRELAPLARFRVARHLRSCPACRKELIQMQQLTEELRTDETPEGALEPELRARILASAPTTDDAYRAAKSRRIARKKTVLALGACSLVGGLLYVGMQNGGGFNADSPPVAPSNGPQIESYFSQKPAPSAGAASPSSAAISRSAGNPAVPAIPSPRPNSVFADGHVKWLDKTPAEPRRASSAGSASSTDFSASPETYSATVVNGGAIPLDNSIVPQTRAVHREGSVSVSVENAESSSDDVQSLVKNFGGFVAQNSLETGASGRRTATLDCRVPVADFEKMVSKVGALGRVTAKSVSGRDITAQIAGAAARRETLTKELAIAQARLDAKVKAAKKRDAGQVLELRSDVREVRLQAAQARAQLEAFQKYGNTSTLWVSLQDRAPLKAAGLTDNLGFGANPVWNTFLSNARIPFQLLLLVIAYVPIWLPALFLWRKFGRKWLAE